MTTDRKSTYAQERLDPRWQKKRLEIMHRDEFKCLDCGDGEETLNVHHSYYVKGRRCWEYPSFSLETLCRSCHESRHNRYVSDDEVDGPLTEWEIEMDWMTRGRPMEIGPLWRLAAEVSQSLKSGQSLDKIADIVEAGRK